MRERLRGGGLQAPGKGFLFCPANVHPKVSIFLNREIKMEEGASTLKTRTNRALALKASSDCIHLKSSFINCRSYKNHITSITTEGMIEEFIAELEELF